PGRFNDAHAGEDITGGAGVADVAVRGFAHHDAFVGDFGKLVDEVHLCGLGHAYDARSLLQRSPQQTLEVPPATAEFVEVVDRDHRRARETATERKDWDRVEEDRGAHAPQR